MKNTVVAAAGGPLPGFVPDPASTEAFLSALPGLNPTDDLERMQRLLQTLETQKVDSATRVACMERFEAPLDAITRQVRKQHVGLALPLSEYELALTQLLAQVHAGVAAGFETALQPLIEDGREIPGMSRQRGLDALRGAIRSLAEALNCAWSSYQGPLPGLWNRLHRLHHFAWKHGLNQERDGSLNAAGRIYVRSVLLGLADPFALPYRGVDKVSDFLDKVSGGVTIGTEPPETDHQHLFVIDPAIDQPAIPLLRNNLLSRETLILDTTTVVKQVHKRTQQSVGATLVQKGVARFSEMERLAILRMLAGHWRHRPLRTKQRQETQRDLELTIGLSAVAWLLNGNKPVRDVQNISDFATAATMLRGTFGQQLTAGSEPARIRHWQVLDSGDHGLRLCYTGEERDTRVGELVAWRLQGSDYPWSVGIVRWARDVEQNRLEVGVFELGDNGAPATVKLVTEGESEPVTALHFPATCAEDGSASSAETLVAASGLYSPHAAMWLKLATEDHLIVATNLRVTTRSFDWFEVDREQAPDIVARQPRRADRTDPEDPWPVF
ncbi:MAG: hypothetical protein LJE84_10025 [Gammaproteobacteria bacterium]|nr:hypothetical protein [Gammaproteobacteria bacterium]